MDSIERWIVFSNSRKKLRYKDDEFIINGDKFFFFSYKENTEGGHSL